MDESGRDGLGHVAHAFIILSSIKDIPQTQ